MTKLPRKLSTHPFLPKLKTLDFTVVQGDPQKSSVYQLARIFTKAKMEHPATFSQAQDKYGCRFLCSKTIVPSNFVALTVK